MAEYYSIIYILYIYTERERVCTCVREHSFFIHSSVYGHLGFFHVLAIVNRASVNIGLYVSFSVLVSSGYMPSNGIAGSCGGFIPSF